MALGKLSNLDIKLRPHQEEILKYRSGKMGVAAVPGSGKTWTLSLLAAKIIASGELEDDQEVLLVTLVNSAVDNFYHRVSNFVKSFGLMPYIGYRVRTLHGLAHDIVRERPDLAGLADDFLIIDEAESNRMLNQIIQSWLKNSPGVFENYIKKDLEEYEIRRARERDFPALLGSVALSFIRYCKDRQITPERLREKLDQVPINLQLAEVGWEIFRDYQRGLAYRGAVDFDDLIRMALQTLEADPEYLSRVQYRWPIILEDEAQDSSRLQELILQKIAGDPGNWVRVGDPNQAIFETFTTADPKHLRNFLQRNDVVARELPSSGRSTESIISLANFLVEWTSGCHPEPEIQDALHAPPLIEPVPEDDPQPNPVDNPNRIALLGSKFSPQKEIIMVADSLSRWLPEHQDWTVAILVPRNKRGFEITDELQRRGIAYEDGLLKSSQSTRISVGVLKNLFGYLSDPLSSRKMAEVFRDWVEEKFYGESEKPQIERMVKVLKKIAHMEDFLWPEFDRDWMAQQGIEHEYPLDFKIIVEFRNLLRRWQSATIIPVDQMALLIAQDFFTDPVQIALIHKLAILLRQVQQLHPSWRIPEMMEELEQIAQNQRRFIGFSSEDIGFDPDLYKGKVIISTIHKAKGLEWDRVYLMSANNYDFPSNSEEDQFIAERWFIRNKLNMQAETLAQLETVLSTDEYEWYEEGRATQRSRLDYVRERLRLFYVGITRAKKELVITWNSGRVGELEPAKPFEALRGFWEKRMKDLEV